MDELLIDVSFSKAPTYKTQSTFQQCVLSCLEKRRKPFSEYAFISTIPIPHLKFNQNKKNHTFSFSLCTKVSNEKNKKKRRVRMKKN